MITKFPKVARSGFRRTSVTPIEPGDVIFAHRRTFDQSDDGVSDLGREVMLTRGVHRVGDMELPAPRLLDPAAVPSMRWGILGPGAIAESLASTVLTNSSQRIGAIASTTPGRAAAFAARFSVPVALSSYEELVARNDIDAVYVANQPNDHGAAALMALEAGKPVLVEKPFTKNVSEASAVFQRGRELGLLVMEAMWTRYLPQTDVVRQLIAAGPSVNHDSC